MDKELVGQSQPEDYGQHLYVQLEVVMNYVPQGSVLGLILFIISISDIEEKIKCIFSKSADVTKLSSAADSKKKVHHPEGARQV